MATPIGRRLTAFDPEPPPGTLVRDNCGREWSRDDEGGPAGWTEPEADHHNPQTWTKIAGNYGPVRVLEWGDDED